MRALPATACLAASVGALIAAAPAWATPGSQEGDTRPTWQTIYYGRGAVASGAAKPKVVRLRMELARPSKARYPGRRPVVILLHGGGFNHGTHRGSDILRLAGGFAERGIAAASIEYRLQPSSPIPSPRVARLLTTRILSDSEDDRSTGVVAAADDTLTAIDYLRSEAEELGLDRRRIGLVGESAGAATANHVAYALDDYGIATPRIRFVGSLWGAMMITPPRRPRSSPLRQIENGEPPLFLAHGELDRSVMCPPAQSAAIATRARRQGIEVKYLRLLGRGHGFQRSGFFRRDRTTGQSTMDRLIDFAAEHLR